MEPRATHDLKFGLLLVGRFERGEGRRGGWRQDVYVRNEDGTRIPENIYAEGHDDVSAPHVKYPRGYDARCSCCWLGMHHTQEAHASRMREASERP